MTRGDQALMKPGLQLYFQKELLYPKLHISRNERYKVTESAQHYISLTFIGTRMFSAYLFIYKGLCVMYIIFWPCGLLTFCNSFLIKVGHPENLLSLYLSSLQSPSGNRATFLWSKVAVGYNKERTY